jgi:hypothetical protein
VRNAIAKADANEAALAGICLGQLLASAKLAGPAGKELTRELGSRAKAKERAEEADGKAQRVRELFAQTREQNPGGKLTKIYKDIAQQTGVKSRTVRAYLQGRSGNG